MALEEDALEEGASPPLHQNQDQDTEQLTLVSFSFYGVLHGSGGVQLMRHCRRP